MNYASELRKIISKLKFRHPRFVSVTPQILIYTPFQHHYGLLVLTGSPTQRYFTVEWQINILCEPDSRPGIKLGRMYGLVGRSAHFKPPGKNGLFEIDDPSMADDFFDQIEVEVIPQFNRLDRFDKVIDFEINFQDMYVTKTARWKSLMSAALGDIPTAQKLWRSCDTADYSWRVPRMTEEWGEYEEWCRISGPLMKGDRVALANLLHEWEGRGVRGTKVERYWTSSPFPLESLE